MQFVNYGVSNILYFVLPDMVTQKARVNPTIAVGDFKISKDGGAFVNVDNLPVVTPAGGRQVKLILSIAECTCKSAIIQCIDAVGDEWDDNFLDIITINNSNAYIVSIDSNVMLWNGAVAPANTGDSFARLGVPVGASISVDLASVKSDSVEIVSVLPVSGKIAGKTQTDLIQADTTIIVDKLPVNEIADSHMLTTVQGDVSGIFNKLPANIMVDSDDFADTALIIDNIANKLPVTGIIAGSNELDNVKTDTGSVVTKLPLTGLIAGNDLLTLSKAGIDMTVNKLPTIGYIAGKNSMDAIGVDVSSIVNLIPAEVASAVSIEEVKGLIDWIVSKIHESGVASAGELGMVGQGVGLILGKLPSDIVMGTEDLISQFAVVTGKEEEINGLIDTIITKLPNNTISDFSIINTLVDGMTIEYCFRLFLSLVNGKFIINKDEGTITFYNRDNQTVLTVVKTTELGRTRLI